MSQRWKDNFLIFITFALSFLSFLSLMSRAPFLSFWLQETPFAIVSCYIIYLVSCSNVKKMYCKRAHLLSSHSRLFIHSFIHSFIIRVNPFFFSFFSAFVPLHRLMHGLVCGGGKVFPAMVLDNLWAQAADQHRVECCNQLNVMLLNKYCSWKAPLGRKQ